MGFSEYSYRPILNSTKNEDNYKSFKRDFNENDDSNHNSGNLVPSDQIYEGILEIFNSPLKGKKQFCGKYIELSFQHVVETIFPNVFNIDDDMLSVAESEYIEEQEYIDVDQH